MSETPYNAVARLGMNEDFLRLRTWLSEELTEQDRLNRRLNGDELHRGQGRALYLERLIEQTDPDYARTILRRTQQR